MKKKKKKKTSRKTKSENQQRKTRSSRKLTASETKQMKRKARARPEIEAVPALDVSLPVAHAGAGYLVAETFLERNGAGILDIVAPKGTRVESWCCFGRPARGKSKDWVVVSNYPDENRRLQVPVPRTHFYVWNFGEAPADAEDGERVWRLHGHNVAFSGLGRDICWRLVLRLAPVTLPVTKGSRRRLPPRGAAVKKVTPRKPARPVTIKVPA